MGGKLQLLERRREASHFVDGGRQHHNGLFVEDDLKFQARVPNRFHHLSLVGAPGGYDDVSGADTRDAGLPKMVEKILRRSGGERTHLASGRIVKNGAV